MLKTHGDEILSSVIDAVSELLEVPKAEIVHSTVLLDLGAQSSDFVGLVMRLEKSHAIEIPRAFAIPDSYSIDTFVQIIAQAVARNDILREEAGRIST